MAYELAPAPVLASRTVSQCTENEWTPKRVHSHNCAVQAMSVAAELPFDSEWVLDWAHIGRLLRYADQAFTPLAYGRLTASGSAFELWDLFVRFRSFVWTGETDRWRKLGDRVYRLLELRETRDPNVLQQTRHARRRLMDVLSYLTNNVDAGPSGALKRRARGSCSEAISLDCRAMGVLALATDVPTRLTPSLNSKSG